MRRSRAALLSVLLVSIALPMAVVPVLARDPAAAQHDRTVAYWTKERIANAAPRDFVKTPGGQFVAARGKPPGGGTPPGGSTGSVLGASWAKGGQVLRTTGKVLFTLNSGNYICTGTVVTDGTAGRSIVVSAAHCAWDGADGGFARNWMFIPEFDADARRTPARRRSGAAGRRPRSSSTGASPRPAGSTTRPSSTTGRSPSSPRPARRGRRWTSRPAASTSTRRRWPPAARCSTSAIPRPASTTAATSPTAPTRCSPTRPWPTGRSGSTAT